MPDQQPSTLPPPGRRRARPLPKGRPVEAAALAEIRAALDGLPRAPGLLIECLHRIQDRFGGLSEAHLAALALELGLPQAAVYETASFYAHFDLLRAGETPPPLTIRVCDGIVCEQAGARKLLAGLAERLGLQTRILAAPCMGACDKAPAVAVGQRQIGFADAEKVAAAVARGDSRPVLPDYLGLDAYRAKGGYRTLGECFAGTRSREQVIEMLDASELRGMGGAGFPAARKLRFVRQGPKPRLVAINADEGEPGTFKDRFCLETDPHRVLEGMLTAAWVVEAEDVYIYLRDEYAALREVLALEIRRLTEAGLTGGIRIHLRRGAGAYVCGEESALIESLEGKRGLPRHKPPFPAQHGLFGHPTLVTNVETMYWAAHILEHGPDWFQQRGSHDGHGLRFYSVSGRVRRPGVKLAPVGVTVRELIEDHAGGMQDGHRFKAYLPGGASGGILPAGMDSLPLDFGTLEPYGCFIGSAAVIVLSDHDDLRAVALNAMRFFADESCGQCTPCRKGTEKLETLMAADHWDETLMTELARAMADASICGLGQAAPNPLLSLFRYFREEIRP